MCGLAPRWVISRSVKKASRIGASAVMMASRRRRAALRWLEPPGGQGEQLGDGLEIPVIPTSE